MELTFIAVKGGDLKWQPSSTHQPRPPHPMESLRFPSATPRDKVSCRVWYMHYADSCIFKVLPHTVLSVTLKTTPIAMTIQHHRTRV